MILSFALRHLPAIPEGQLVLDEDKAGKKKKKRIEKIQIFYVSKEKNGT